MAFYWHNQMHIVEKHTAVSASFYAARAAVCTDPFWTRRAGIARGKAHDQAMLRPLDTECPVRLSNEATIDTIAAAQGDFVEWKSGVSHRLLGRPVVFAGTVEVAPLLLQHVPGDTIRTLVHRWARCIPADLAWRIAAYLWDKEVLIPHPRAGQGGLAVPVGYHQRSTQVANWQD
jgi:hypothetical protein